MVSQNFPVDDQGQKETLRAQLSIPKSTDLENGADRDRSRKKEYPAFAVNHSHWLIQGRIIVYLAERYVTSLPRYIALLAPLSASHQILSFTPLLL